MVDEEISPNDIAIVGMALRVPGARDISTFWKNLCTGVESVRSLSTEELAEAGESAERIHHPNYVARTADLEGMEMFDADFFGLSPKEAAIMDPQHRQFLECAWEAMEDAGRTPDTSAGPVGVFAGCGMGSYFYFNVCSNRQLVDETGMFLLRHTGNDKDFLSTRASFTFDLRGPSVNVQTACSTSLVAVHYACQSLMSGECDMALAGGVTIELPHRRGYVFQDGEILSPDGHCRAFDHRAAGTVFGSGVGIVALRRLSDALADGDIIHAVIKASALNNDGGTKAGYLAPSVSGQAEAIVEAQVLSGLPVDTIGYVECHGTGTYLGDPIEVEALTQAFRQGTDKTGFCRIGSVKTNIGHLDTAAGVVGLIKAALSVKHGQIPPSLNYERPNPSIPFDTSPFVVNDRLSDWPKLGGPRRAAINSLGVGGTNAHLILEQAPSSANHGGRPASAENDNTPRLLVFSAKSRKALDGAVERLAARLETDAALSLADAAFTLGTGRKSFEHRRVVAVRGRQDAIAVLSDPESRRPQTHTALDATAGAVFMFPGGGAQHAGMAARLYAEDSAFRATVEEGLAALGPEAAQQIRAAWLDAPLGDPAAARTMLKPSVQLPAILIIEIAVSRHLMAHGIRPAALIGHSMGENAAACIAGVFNYADAVRLVRLRGELFDTIAPGGMLSVPMDPTALRACLPAELDLASVNAPQFCVVSGRNEDLERFRETLRQQGVDAARVPIDIAAHSRMLDAILPRFEAFLRSIHLSAPRVPIMSNLTGTWLADAEATDPLYWCRHLRSTVEFARGMAVLAEERARVYLEVGPGRALSSLAKAQGSIDANHIINALPHADEGADDRLSLMTALGRAWATGLSGTYAPLWTAPGARRASMPTYAFQHRRYFIEAAAPERNDTDTAPLLRRDDIADWGWRPVFKRSIADIESDIVAEPRFWLVFLDETGTGATLVERLRAEGHRVASVRQGDNFARRGKDDYVLCPEGGRPGYDALFSGLAADGELPSQILHLWLLTDRETHRAGSSFFHRNQECGFYSLLHLAQAMADAGLGAPLHVTVVTNGMMRVANEALPYPEKATILGPCQVLPQEMPGVTVRVVDCDLPMASDHPQERRRLFKRTSDGTQSRPVNTARELWDELMSAPATERVAHRKGERWTVGHGRLKLPSTADVPFREGGSYVFTGGHGDLALALGSELAGRYRADITLIGRRSLPPRGEWAALRRALPCGDRTRRVIEGVEAIEALGARVLCLTADVGNQEAMSAAIAEVKEAFGRIDGVFHTAGLVKDDLIPLKTQMDAEEVMAPKVHGTEVLAACLDAEPIDFLVLFSSTSTDTAPAGQVDYVAANAYLNAFAESCRGRAGRRTLAIHWGVWDETGLAARAMGRQGHEAEREGGPALGPIFTHWVADADGVEWLERDMSPQRDWLLGEHRLASGQALLPGTGYIELMAEAAREYGLDGGLQLSDLVFLRPLDVADGAQKTVRLRLEKRRDGWRAEVMAAAPGMAFQRHAEAMLKPVDLPARSMEEAALRARCPQRSVAPRGGTLIASQEAHVRFGPRWRVLRELALGPSEAVARLVMAPEAKGDDMIAHPALVDIATGCGMDLIPSYKADAGLWAPASYGSIRLHAPLGEEIVSHLRLAEDDGLGDGYAAFDVTIANADGTVAMEIERFIVKRLDGAMSFGQAEATAQPARKAPAAAPSPALAALAAQVAQGIRPAEGFEALARAMATRETQPIISSMDLNLLIARAARPGESEAKPAQLFERPALERDYVAPRDSVERKLAEFWRELLGVQEIGVEDSFFDLGGHSLIAVRLFRMIRQSYGLDLPISVLFEAPTIASSAALIRERASVGDDEDDARPAAAEGEVRRMTHLVAMHPGRDQKATPFFLCAGMFGNILNLRHLALHLGVDRPVYGLQARGLYGMEAPHESFEDAAADILAEIRSIQPEGPYLLGGFSGGGLTAFEIARQLTEAGETVERLIMLDTPLPTQPELSQIDRLDMKLQDLKRNKLSFVSQWWRNRQLWEKEQRERESAAAQESGSAQFHNLNIESAFRRALLRYQVRPYAGTVHLFRPVPDVVYRLRDGRRLQEGRTIVLDDNGWTPYVGELVVSIVPGDHDGMVLEPCVRVLAARMRQCLSEAEVPARESQALLMAAE